MKVIIRQSEGDYIRGGFWTEKPGMAEVASRVVSDPYYGCDDLGFRVIVEVQ